MRKSYLKLIARKAGKAINILDRIHIMAHLSKSIDGVRAQEASKKKFSKFSRQSGRKARRTAGQLV